MEVMAKGYAYARSQAFIASEPFQTMTWLRGVGSGIFVLGMIPLVWFMVTRWFNLKTAQTAEEQMVVPPSVLAVATTNGNGYKNGATVPAGDKQERATL
jgi:hypothetical protein